MLRTSALHPSGFQTSAPEVRGAALRAGGALQPGPRRTPSGPRRRALPWSRRRAPPGSNAECCSSVSLLSASWVTVRNAWTRGSRGEGAQCCAPDVVETLS